MKKRHNRTAVLFTLFTLIAVSFIGCSPNEPKPSPPEPTPEIRDTLTLALTDKTHRSVTLNVKTTANAEDYAKNKIKLIRKPSGGEGQDTLVAEYSAATLDTTIIDDNDGEGLQLETSYAYYTVRIDSAGAEKDSSAFITAQTLGATSHDYSWEEIIIGDDGYGNALYDVWGTDENNVYAVGGVRINDTTYGVIHWDGNEWEPVKKVGGVYAIFGFNEEDIWAVGGAVEHFDGYKWERIDAKTVNNQDIVLDDILYYNRGYRAIWGTSSNNLYLGNSRGKIVHWDGSRGEVLSENDGMYIKNMNGLSDDFIIAVGTSFVTPSLTLLFNGKLWKSYPNVNNTYSLNSVAIVNKQHIYWGGDGIFETKREDFRRTYSSGYYIWDVYYNKETGETYASGSFDGIYIHNGLEWKNFKDIASSDGSQYTGIFSIGGKVYFVGSTTYKAKITIGRK